MAGCLDLWPKRISVMLASIWACSDWVTTLGPPAPFKFVPGKFVGTKALAAEFKPGGWLMPKLLLLWLLSDPELVTSPLWKAESLLRSRQSKFELSEAFWCPRTWVCKSGWVAWLTGCWES